MNEEAQYTIDRAIKDLEKAFHSTLPEIERKELDVIMLCMSWDKAQDADEDCVQLLQAIII